MDRSDASTRRVPERPDYRTYLKSLEWRQRAREIKWWAQLRCEMCSAGFAGLHVHHLHYRTLGQETPRDLIAICSNCHKAVHRDPERQKRAEQIAATHRATWPWDRG